MGCVCSRNANTDLQGDFNFNKERLQGSKRRLSGSTRCDDEGRITNAINVKDKEKEKEKGIKANGIATMTITTNNDESKTKQSKLTMDISPTPRNLPKHVEGEQIAAGWPAWLSNVAKEAINGWIPRRADSFEKLDKIGQGTYSNVYKARDLETGKIVALKKVRFDNLEPESVRFMAREIQVLRRLDHPNVIKLEGLVTSRMSCSLYLVFEYMEHDLAGLSASLGKTFTEPQVKCYLQQLLRGLDHCHSRGVLHRDIKGSNLLLDNSGVLKIADFGLATFFRPDQNQPLTSRVVTLWYRPPELLLGATEYGIGVDLWSTGCILAELLAGKPIMPGRTEVEQLHKIFKLCGSPSEEYWRKSKLPHATIFKPKQPYKRCLAETFKDFPPSSLALLETLLAIEPTDRSTASTALDSEYFTTKPLACDPSILPKYPPSKELDAKLRDEEARRQRAAGGRIHGVDAAKHTSKAIPAPDANAELATSIQKCRLTSNTSVKSQSEKFNRRQEDAVGFPIDPPNADGNRPPANLNAIYVRKQKEDAKNPPRATSLSLRSQSVYNGSQSEGLSSVLIKDNESAEQRQGYVTDRNEESGSICNGVEGSQIHGPAQCRGLNMEFNTSQADRTYFSGPLLHPSANHDEILGQHERHVQQVVRRSRQGRIHNPVSVASSHQVSWPSVSNGNTRIKDSIKTQEVSQLSNGQRKPLRNATDMQGLPVVMENYEKEREM